MANLGISTRGAVACRADYRNGAALAKAWASIRVLYMNFKYFGVIGPGFLNQVPTLRTSADPLPNSARVEGSLFGQGALTAEVIWEPTCHKAPHRAARIRELNALPSWASASSLLACEFPSSCLSFNLANLCGYACMRNIMT